MCVLGAIGLGAAALLAGVHHLTRERIELARAREASSTLHQVLPPDSHDNELVTDTVTAAIPGLAGDATVYRARSNGRPSGVVFEVTTEDGYSGPIRLMVGVDAAGRVTGVRVLQHRETPGLGDGIEAARSDWILGFDGRALGDPEKERWRSSRRGGDFDTLTSATITTEAVVTAVRRVLEYFEANRDELFQPSAEPAAGVDATR